MSLESKIMGITTDNASNNSTFMTSLSIWVAENVINFNKKEQHIRCFAHSINLSVKEALSCLDGKISLLRELIVKICASSLRREKLSNACKNNDINNLKPILDIPTRWNSTFDMIKKALQLKVVLEYIVFQDKDLKKYTFSEEKWAIFEQIKNFLEIFKKVTVIMSGSHYPTLSLTVPLYNILIDHVEDVIDNDKEEDDDDDDDDDNENEENNKENDRENDDDEKWNQIVKKSSKKG
ncbi:unnamed protein product [Rhizophagus irregularis]|nr:unnamed protein product [Rhizophagus irregularis]